jgi:hypothetical protein
MDGMIGQALAVPARRLLHRLGSTAHIARV